MDCLFLDFTYNLLKFHYGDHHRLGCLSDLKKKKREFEVYDLFRNVDAILQGYCYCH